MRKEPTFIRWLACSRQNRVSRSNKFMNLYRPGSYAALIATDIATGCSDSCRVGLHPHWETAPYHAARRVEEQRGSLGHAATLRFFSPLGEPDRPFSSIRLSDKVSDLRTRTAMPKSLQLGKTKRVIEVLVREPSCSRVANLVLIA
jgi:hypothetical protein